MTFTAFFPIILLILIVSVIYLIIKTGNSRKVIQVPKKIIEWFFWIYAAILLVATGLYFINAMEIIPHEKAISADMVEQTAQHLHEAAMKGDIDEVDSEYLIEKWSFEFLEKELTIEALENNSNPLFVLIERKSEDDNIIEAGYYHTPTSLEGIELNNPPVPELEMDDNLLTIRKPKQEELRFTAFTQEFPFSQFTEEGGMFQPVNHGGTLLYIKIPKNLKLNTEETMVEFVGDQAFLD